MYLSTVKIKNFRGYGENHEREDRCFIYDELDAPLVVFKGYNGFGKTSFYEAIEWCLTDKVYRLEKFYDDKTYQVNELKKSHYLKFYHPLHGNTLKREVYVELIFDNGLKIIRKSESNVLRTTEKDTSYKSTSLMGNSELKEVTTEKILHTFILKAKNKETFFHTHMLGQESISDFLRHNSPSERREIFMQLLQEEKLNELFIGIQKYKTNGNALIKKISTYEKNQVKYKNDQQEIEKFIKKHDFNDISSYLQTLNKEYLKILPLIKENLVREELHLDSIITTEGINLNNSVSFLQSISFAKQKIPSLKENLISEQEKLKRIKKQIETLELLEQARNKMKKSDHAVKLLENNLKSLQVQLHDYNQVIIEYTQNKNEFDKKINELVSYKEIFSSLYQNINVTKMTIQEDFLNELNIESEKFSLFSNKYKQYIQEQKINIIMPELDLIWFHNIKNNFEKLEMKRKDELDELENLRKLKGKVSTLNKQYQSALTSVKQLISDNSQEIEKCPVCLNEDFSDEKYSAENIKDWDSALSISNKIVSIIDSTFAAGNEQVEELSQIESENLENIRKVEEEIKGEILEKIIAELNNIRNSFINVITLLEKHYNDVLVNISTNMDKQKSRKNIVSQQIGRISESIIALYGKEFDINELDLLKLEQIVEDKKNWFIENKSKLDFLNGNITSTSIETEITLIMEDDYKEYNKDVLFKNIEDNNKKLEYLSNLTLVLDGIIKYKIPVEYESSLSEFDRIETKIDQISKKMQLTKSYQEQVDTFHGRLLGKQRQIVKERLENHPIVSWVYETINPHPFYKKLSITNTERGTNFIGKTQLEDKIDLYLDQMFSAAQLNILALSIFFGLGLTQRYSKLQQLFLDDPIQSMDDVNILAFIDVLRAIMDSRYGDKHIIISTHNEDFAQLLAIKMRNRRMVQYSIEGYTEEGPKIRKL